MHDQNLWGRAALWLGDPDGDPDDDDGDDDTDVYVDHGDPVAAGEATNANA